MHGVRDWKWGLFYSVCSLMILSTTYSWSTCRRPNILLKQAPLFVFSHHDVIITSCLSLIVLWWSSFMLNSTNKITSAQAEFIDRCNNLHTFLDIEVWISYHKSTLSWPLITMANDDKGLPDEKISHSMITSDQFIIYNGLQRDLVMQIYAFHCNHVAHNIHLQSVRLVGEIRAE